MLLMENYSSKKCFAPGSTVQIIILYWRHLSNPSQASQTLLPVEGREQFTPYLLTTE